MKKTWILFTLCALVCGAAAVSVAVAGEQASDEVRIAKLVTEMETMEATELAALEPMRVRRFEVPPPGVDVMRARLSETYTVEGIGQDTVELTGWIAVKHFGTRTAEGETELNWNTAVTSTEFVGMGLSGHSELFGPVEVTLSGRDQMIGQVGKIDLPDYAETVLLASLEKTSTEEPTRDGTTENTVDAATVEPAEGACVAGVDVAISMPALELEMMTQRPVHWYSLVDTIPPVGHVASIAVEPTPLVSEGRVVGTLESGRVNFREVVRHLPLNDAPSYDADQIARADG